MNWLIHSNGGLIARITAGALIFLSLAMIDLRKHGSNATRWREYLFLLACVAAAMIYGILNDQITCSISWEYFYYGKSLESVLGPDLPPEPIALHWQAAKIGMMATWSVGLLLGAAMLTANNPHRPPRRDRPRVSYRAMLGMLSIIMMITICFAIVGGIAGRSGWLNWASPDFREMWGSGTFRPRRFIGVWGIHLGGYLGGLVGAIWGIRRITHHRASNAKALDKPE